MPHRIKEFFKKIKYRFKGCINKRNNNCNWPQLTAYCGCLKLSTGIYIRSVIAAVLVTISLVQYCYLLVHLRGVHEFLPGNFTEAEDAEFDLDKIISIYSVLKIYFISWIVLIALYILFLIITVYAVYKKKQKLLKIIVYITIPYCVLGLLYSFFILAINEYSYSLRILLLISYVMELYNFLAIHSYYKQLRGKSLLVVEENLEIRPPTASTHFTTVIRVQPTANNEGSIEMHCRSCTCFIQGNIPIAGIVTAQPEATQHYKTYGTNEVVNEVDNQEPSQSATESVQEMNSGTSTGCEARVIRPSDLSLETVKEDKIDLSDAPVIYDEQQLNVGSSPVIEDRAVKQEPTQHKIDTKSSSFGSQLNNK